MEQSLRLSDVPDPLDVAALVHRDVEETICHKYTHPTPSPHDARVDAIRYANARIRLLDQTTLPGGITSSDNTIEQDDEFDTFTENMIEICGWRSALTESKSGNWGIFQDQLIARAREIYQTSMELEMYLTEGEISDVKNDVEGDSIAFINLANSL
jgi:hypothetical protein